MACAPGLDGRGGVADTGVLNPKAFDDGGDGGVAVRVMIVGELRDIRALQAISIACASRLKIRSNQHAIPKLFNDRPSNFLFFI